MVELTIPLVLQIIQTVSLVVGIIYYLTIMRNSQKNQEIQLETRQAQLFMQMFNRLRDETKGLRAREKIQNSTFETVDDYLEALDTDELLQKVLEAYGNFYEGLGVLVKEGLLNIRYVALMWAGPTRMYWEFLEPLLEDLRIHYRYPRFLSETEYVCKETIRYMEEHPELKT